MLLLQVEPRHASPFWSAHSFLCRWKQELFVEIRAEAVHAALAEYTEGRRERPSMLQPQRRRAAVSSEVSRGYLPERRKSVLDSTGPNHRGSKCVYGNFRKVPESRSFPEKNILKTGIMGKKTEKKAVSIENYIIKKVHFLCMTWWKIWQCRRIFISHFLYRNMRKTSYWIIC